MLIDRMLKKKVKSKNKNMMKKTCQWCLMHLQDLHISMKMKVTSTMIMGVLILHLKMLLHRSTMVVSTKGKKNVQNAAKSIIKNYPIPFLMILLALLHLTYPRIIFLLPTIIKLQWRVCWIIRKVSLLLIFRRDLHIKIILVMYSLLYQETNFTRTNGFKERERRYTENVISINFLPLQLLPLKLLYKRCMVLARGLIIRSIFF